jgi:protein phosphatase
LESACPSPETLRLDISGSALTDAGCVRERNEDCCAISRSEDYPESSRRAVLALVADGMGGCRAGEVASRLAVELVTQAYFDLPAESAHALESAFHQANAHIHTLSLARDDIWGMGTTCTALAIEGRLAHSAHVGDSRLYLIRSGAIYQMTEDHSLPAELVRRGELTRSAAARHPDRNKILRAMGSRPTLQVATWSRPLPIHSGDCFVLCSDGLHNSVADHELRDAAESGDAAAACRNLVATARRRGGYDNITVAIVRIAF